KQVFVAILPNLSNIFYCYPFQLYIRLRIFKLFINSDTYHTPDHRSLQQSSSHLSSISRVPRSTDRNNHCSYPLPWSCDNPHTTSSSTENIDKLLPSILSARDKSDIPHLQLLRVASD